MSVVSEAEARHEWPIPFVTRKSTILLLLRVVGMLLAFELAYLALRYYGNRAEIAGMGSLWIFFFFVLAQLAVAVFFYLRWLLETYEVHHDDLHHNSGILFRKERTYPFNNIQTITCNQSPLGRVYHYGEVRFLIPTLGHELVFKEVPHPHHFISTIRHVMPYPDRAKFILHG